jgi:hypothetical protein
MSNIQHTHMIHLDRALGALHHESSAVLSEHPELKVNNAM